jgi:hypothetical protein
MTAGEPGRGWFAWVGVVTALTYAWVGSVVYFGLQYIGAGLEGWSAAYDGSAGHSAALTNTVAESGDRVALALVLGPLGIALVAALGRLKAASAVFAVIAVAALLLCVASAA